MSEDIQATLWNSKTYKVKRNGKSKARGGIKKIE